MCGRFTLEAPPDQLSKIFGLSSLPDITPRYNIAPSQQVAVVRNLGGESHLDFLKWGLVPSWADDETIGYKLVNARSETVFEKNSFKRPIRSRRCLIPASGFYEWMHEGESAIPFYISMANGAPMAFAGIWEQWKSPDNTFLETCAILTTASNSLMQKIHDRMPVILHPDEYSLWLDREVSDPARIQPLFKPYPADVMKFHSVSAVVNNPRNDTPECIAQVAATG